MQSKGEVIIYKTNDRQTHIEVKFEQDTVWLSQVQMATLFKQTRQNISLHINNLYKERELFKQSTIKESLIVQIEGGRKISRKIDFYNLDVIISVGYRVKSLQGTQFRQWATQKLKDYLIKGYDINEKRLKATQGKFTDLKKTIKLLENVANVKKLSSDEATGLLKVVSDYAYALDTLDKYDHQTLKKPGKTSKEKFLITYDEAITAIKKLKQKFGGSSLFGNEKDKSFKSSLENIPLSPLSLPLEQF